jgi:hypothetical protein
LRIESNTARKRCLFTVTSALTECAFSWKFALLRSGTHEHSKLKSVVRSCLTPKPPKTRPVRVPGSILWTFGFEDLALLAFAPDGLQKVSTLGSGNLVDSSPVEVCEVEAGEACGVEEDVHGRDPPVLRRRPRLASWRAASGERSRMAPI